MTADLFTISGATLSDCGTYRYELYRQWDPRLPLLEWVMLNPSTADAELDDQTIRRCIGFARAWQRGGILVRNLFALRATNPGELLRHADPIGPLNDTYLTRRTPDELDNARVTQTIAAWGTHGDLYGRALEVAAVYAAAGVQLHHLGLTVSGAPRHPSRLPSTVQPQPYRSAA